jgi:hypothetical protein
MQFRYQIRDTQAVKALPTVLKRSKGPGMLAEKLAIQIQWMQKKGIGIGLKESECPQPVQKPPLPGTIIYFSSAIEQQ